MCIVIKRLLSISRKSASTLSFSSGASICKKETAPYLLPVLKLLPSRNSKDEGAIKSLVDSPDGTSHFQSKLNCSLPSILIILWQSFSRSFPSRDSTDTPIRFSPFHRSFSILSNLGFATLMLSASMPKVRYLVFVKPLFPFAS